jgi:Ca2+-binding RTX toxin-like protein
MKKCGWTLVALTPALVIVGVLSLPAKGAATRCLGRTATIVGTPRNDDIIGTSGDDVIVGRGGTDSIEGRGGNDRICGGKGGFGDDELETLLGGAGSDRIDGSWGSDGLSGGAGSDLLVGGPGEYDFFNGGPGSDRIIGGRGEFDDPGSDQFFGGAGGDEVILFAGRKGGGEDTVHGGPGIDRGTFGLYGEQDSLTVNLARGFVSGERTGRDRIFSIRNAWVICRPCVLIGDEHSNSLESYIGDDRIEGRGGDDRLSSSGGDDSLDGGSGNNSNDGGPGIDTCIRPDTAGGAVACEA